MAVVIGEIVTETLVGPGGSNRPDGGRRTEGVDAAARDEAEVDAIVRRAAERVLETLRREWDR